MDKKKIGSHSSEFYKSWSEVEKKYDEPSAQLIIDKVEIQAILSFSLCFKILSMK